MLNPPFLPLAPNPMTCASREIRRRLSRKAAANDGYVRLDFFLEALVGHVLAGGQPVTLFPEVFLFHLLDLHFCPSSKHAASKIRRISHMIV
jgi:hypothetical protein